jgi:hypothetical protein
MFQKTQIIKTELAKEKKNIQHKNLMPNEAHLWHQTLLSKQGIKMKS